MLKYISIYLWLLLLIQPMMAQESIRPNVAVLTFRGDKSVTPEQLEFITGKFATRLLETKGFTLLERSKIDYILQEQGFQQSGTCSGGDCQVQIGQLLGVDHIVSGTMVRFGSEFALRVDYVDVASGQVQYSTDISVEGELQDVYKDLSQKAAQSLYEKVYGTQEASSSVGAHLDAGLSDVKYKPWSWNKKMALAILGGGVLGVGSGAYFDASGKSYLRDYDEAWSNEDYATSQAAYDNMKDAENYRNISYGVSVGSCVVAAILWFLPEN
jgi:TolB-like protein